MSYDLMVFDKDAAPRDRDAFLAWFDEQTQRTETHGYNDPGVPTAPLQSWFRELVQTFPAMNGPLAVESDSPKVTDFSVGQSVIYCAFAWSQADEAYKLVKELAAKHGVGFFDVSSDAGDIWLPVANARLEKQKG